MMSPAILAKMVQSRMTSSEDCGMGVSTNVWGCVCVGGEMGGKEGKGT